MADRNNRNGSNMNNRSDSDSDLSSSFERFSQSLDKNSQALLKISNFFDKKLDKLFDEFDDFTDEVRETWKEGSQDSQKQLVDASRAYDKYLKDYDTKILTKSQKIGNAIIDSIALVGRKLIAEFTGSVDRVMSSYKEYLGNITVRTQWDNSEYSEAFKGAAEYFRSNGLNKQFDSGDFMQSLEVVLETGLRGDAAERLAYSNLISNKLIPAISTNTVTYRRMSKLFGDSFNQNSIAMAKYTESILGAEGIEEGKYNTMVEQLGDYISYAANGDEDQANKMMNEVLGLMSMLEKSGIDSSDMLESFVQSFEGGFGENYTRAVLQGTFLPGQAIEVFQNGLTDFAKDYLESYDAAGTFKEGNHLNEIKAISEAIGLNSRTAVQIANAERYGKLDRENLSSDFAKFMEGFDKSTEYSKWLKYLKDGNSQTADEMLDKMENNNKAVVDSAVFMSEIPRSTEILDTILTVVSTIATAVVGGKFLDVIKNKFGGDIGNTATNLFGQDKSMIPSWSRHKDWKNLANERGFKSGSEAAKAFGETRDMAGTAGGAMLIAAGVTHGLGDSIEAWNNTDGTFGQKLGNAALGFISGDTSGAVTQDDKIERAKNLKDPTGFGIDWSAVGSAATTGGLIGAGTGAIVGSAAGGVGAAPGAVIGGAVGALTGAVTSVTTQVIKYKDTQTYINSAFYKLGDSIKESSSYFSDLSANTKKYEDALEQVRSQQETLVDLERQLSVTHGEEKTEIEEKISQLRIENDIKKSEAISVASEIGSASEIQGQIDNAKNLMEQSEASYNFYNILEKATRSQIEDLNLENTKINSLSDDKIKGLYGIDSQEGLQNFIRNAVDSGIIKDKVDFNSYADLMNALKAITIDRYSEITGIDDVAGGDFDDWKVSGSVTSYANSKTAEEKKKDYLDARNSYNAISKSANFTVANYDDIEGFDYEVVRSQLVSALGTFVKNAEDPVQALNEKYTSVVEYLKAQGVDEESANNYSDFIENHKNPLVKGWYKVGLNTVPYDNYLAQLHKGEMVLTSDNAEKLRQLSGGGLSGILSALVGLTSLTSSPVPQESQDSDFASTVVAAIESQTEILVSYLSPIVESLTGIAGRSLYPQAVPVTEAAITYSGR